MVKNIISIVQARCNSKRLSRKVLRLIAGKPLIQHIFERISYCSYDINNILATTVSKKDDALIRWAKKNNIKFFRGSEDDVLTRFFEAAKFFKADIIVRITADDPFKEPALIDRGLTILINKKLDFVSNNNPPTFPEGLDTEVFTFKALSRANSMAKKKFDREHVTQFFYKNPKIFKQFNFTHKKSLHLHRWTIDTFDDLKMVRFIYKKLYKKGNLFLMKDILELINAHPSINKINTNVKRSFMYKKR